MIPRTARCRRSGTSGTIPANESGWIAGASPARRRIELHHTRHRGRLRGQRGGHDPDHQRAVRRLPPDPRHRDDREQLHVQLRPASGPSALGRGRQAVFTSMAPMMVRRDGRLLCALGLPGGLRIFPSALQALVNLLDHGMTLQEAVERPESGPRWRRRVGRGVSRRSEERTRGPRARGRAPAAHRRGMNAIAFADDGTLTGAACWRADGTPVAIAGGLARAGVRFSSI